jgi:phosphoglucosamine mutase
MLIDSGAEEQTPGHSATDDSLSKRYEDFLVASADGLNLNGLRLAVDCANGAASHVAARVFQRLVGEVTALFDQPAGRNINDGCGATDTAALQNEVTGQKLALGVALDGDADRLVMIDETGREVRGDYLLYILAVSHQLEGVVATVMSNIGFEQSLRRQGIKLERTAVGDRYVLEGLKRTGYKLGGEQSGHIIWPELLKTGDGLLAAVQVLKAVSQSGKSLAEWCDEVELVPQALVNIPLADKSLLERPAVKDLVKIQTDRLGDSGRLLIRPSGTEPLARVMVEAPYAEKVATQIADQLQTLLKAETGV